MFGRLTNLSVDVGICCWHNLDKVLVHHLHWKKKKKKKSAAINITLEKSWTLAALFKNKTTATRTFVNSFALLMLELEVMLLFIILIVIVE